MIYTEYEDSERRTHAQCVDNFKAALASHYLLGFSSNVTDKVWNAAWMLGEGTYDRVENLYVLLASIVDATWQESQEPC